MSESALLSPLIVVLPAVLQLEVYNIVSSPTIATMANQVLIINVTENVSLSKSPSFTLMDPQLRYLPGVS